MSRNADEGVQTYFELYEKGYEKYQRPDDGNAQAQRTIPGEKAGPQYVIPCCGYGDTDHPYYAEIQKDR